jgi:hypothetical protein
MVNYNKCTLSSKWIIVACCMVHDQCVSQLMQPSRHSQIFTSWVTWPSQSHSHNNRSWSISPSNYPSTPQQPPPKVQVGLIWPVIIPKAAYWLWSSASSIHPPFSFLGQLVNSACVGNCNKQDLEYISSSYMAWTLHQFSNWGLLSPGGGENLDSSVG